MSDRTPVVLVVDTDPETADRLASWLAEDHAVRVAGDGRAALRVVDDADAVVLGPNRPDGPGVADAVRARVLSVPVVALGDHPSVVPDERVDPDDRAALRAAVSRQVARRAYAAGVDDLYDLAVERAAADDDHLDDRLRDLHDTVERRLDELVDRAGFEAAYRAAADPPRDGDDD
jgi:CheY-like chemotaxis protein